MKKKRVEAMRARFACDFSNVRTVSGLTRVCVGFSRAQLKGYPFWPAEVIPDESIDVMPDHARPRAVMGSTQAPFGVQFFGTREFGRVVGKDVAVREWADGIACGFADKAKQKSLIYAIQNARAYVDDGEMRERGWWSQPPPPTTPEATSNVASGKKSRGRGAKNNATGAKRRRGGHALSDSSGVDDDESLMTDGDDALTRGDEFVFPAISTAFTTSRVEYQPPLSALCAGKPPPYERIHRSVFVSVPPPSRMRKDESTTCDCVAPAGALTHGRSKKDVPKTGCGAECMNRQLRYSCDPRNCPCGDACSNRPLGQLPCPKTKITRTLHRGWGLVLQEPVAAGDFIVEYAGEIIDERESAARLFYDKQIGEENFYLMEISNNYVIDAKYKGSIARFINSSCHPNCETQRWVDAATGETRVGIFAIQDIPSGTELTYDYNFAHFGDENATSFVCMCGHPLCRGTLDASKKTVKNFNRRLSLKLPLGGKKSKTLVSKAGVIVDHDQVKNKYKVKIDGSNEIVSVFLDDAKRGVPFKWLDLKVQPSKKAR